MKTSSIISEILTFLLLIGLLIISINCKSDPASSSNTPDSGGVKLTWKHYHHGNCYIPRGEVFDISQDSKGNMWFAADSGVIKFDGTNWVLYGRSAFPKDSYTQDPYDNCFLELTAGYDNCIYAYRNYGSIFKFDGTKWLKSTIIESYIYLREILPLGNELWLLASLGEQDFLITSNGIKTTGTYSSQNSILPNTLRCLTIAQNGQKYVGSQNGLYRFAGNSWTKLSDKYVQSVAIADNGDVWTTGKATLSKYNGSTWQTWDRTNSPIPDDDQLLYHAVWAGGAVWFSKEKNHGLYRFNGNDWTVYSPENSPLPAVPNNTIFKDKNGNLWFPVGNTGVVNLIFK